MLGAAPPANADGPLPPHTFARQRPSEREKPPPTLGEQASAQGGFEIDDSLFGSSDDVELDKSNVLMLGPTGASSFLFLGSCCFCPLKSAKEDTNQLKHILTIQLLLLLLVSVCNR